MALEKPTRGKPVRESIFIFLGEVYHLQQYTENINPTYLNPKDKFLSRFVCRVAKIKTLIFFLFSASIFMPLYRKTIRTVRTSKSVLSFFLENYAQKSTSKIMPTAYGPAINVVVFSSIFMPSLLLSFPSICVLQIFPLAQEKWKLSLFSFSALSSHFNLQK